MKLTAQTTRVRLAISWPMPQMEQISNWAIQITRKISQHEGKWYLGQRWEPLGGEAMVHYDNDDQETVDYSKGWVFSMEWKPDTPPEVKEKYTPQIRQDLRHWAKETGATLQFPQEIGRNPQNPRSKDVSEYWAVLIFPASLLTERGES
jgi:hypothetical protein